MFPMKTTLVIAAVLALLVIAGCAPKAAAPAAPATDKAVADVSTGVSELDQLTADLDTSDLNTLDQELADIQSLELQ